MYNCIGDEEYDGVKEIDDMFLAQGTSYLAYVFLVPFKYT